VYYARFTLCIMLHLHCVLCCVYTVYYATFTLVMTSKIFCYVQFLQSVTWKRYNDFKKLHKAMFSLHKALHRREEFPPFVKAQLFSE